MTMSSLNNSAHSSLGRAALPLVAGTLIVPVIISQFVEQSELLHFQPFSDSEQPEATHSFFLLFSGSNENSVKPIFSSSNVEKSLLNNP